MPKNKAMSKGDVLTGSGYSCYPLVKDKPETNVNFSPDYVDVKTAGFPGNDDSRPHIDDNENGKNRWPMGENKPIDGNKLRFGNNHSFGPGFSKLEKV